MISQTDKRWREVEPMIREYQQADYDLFFLNQLMEFFYPSEVFLRSYHYTEALQTPLGDITLIAKIIQEFGNDIEVIALCAGTLASNLYMVNKQKRRKIYPLILELVRKLEEAEKIITSPRDGPLQAKRCLLACLAATLDVLPNDILKHDLNVYRFIITCLQDLQEPGFDQDPVILFLKEILGVKGHQFLALEQRQEIIRLLLDVNPHRLISYSQEDITSLIQAFSKIDQP